MSGCDRPRGAFLNDWRHSDPTMSSRVSLVDCPHGWLRGRKLADLERAPQVYRELAHSVSRPDRER